MSEVKVYRVIGKITKPKLRTNFQKEVRALRPEDAIEEVYKTFGSKHRVKRFYIRIQQVEEIKDPEEIRDLKIRDIIASSESSPDA